MVEFKVRKPTNKAPWPFMLIAGVEKAGKSWLAAELSRAPGMGDMFWFEVGETSADQYGAIGDYMIVEHDGTFRDILEQLEIAISQPQKDDRPNIIVLDSVTAIWDLLVEEQQQIADRKKGKITISQWGTAKSQWRRLVNLLKRHRGIVLVTARLDLVTEVGDGGRPTGQVFWKVRAEKNLPFEVDGVIELRAHREYTVKGVRSTAEWAENDITRGRDFNLASLLNALQVAGAPRNDVPVRPEPEQYAGEFEGVSFGESE